jgi:hypothetical protein
VRRRRARAETEMIDRCIVKICVKLMLYSMMYEIYDCCEMVLGVRTVNFHDWIGFRNRRLQYTMNMTCGVLAV